MKVNFNLHDSIYTFAHEVFFAANLDNYYFLMVPQIVTFFSTVPNVLKFISPVIALIIFSQMSGLLDYAFIVFVIQN
jgi:hypothetical protein